MTNIFSDEYGRMLQNYVANINKKNVQFYDEYNSNPIVKGGSSTLNVILDEERVPDYDDEMIVEIEPRVKHPRVQRAVKKVLGSGDSGGSKKKGMVLVASGASGAGDSGGGDSGGAVQCTVGSGISAGKIYKKRKSKKNMVKEDMPVVVETVIESVKKTKGRPKKVAKIKAIEVSKDVVKDFDKIEQVDIDKLAGMGKKEDVVKDLKKMLGGNGFTSSSSVGNVIGSGKKPRKVSDWATLLKKTMSEQKLGMKLAMKYIKDNNLYEKK